MPSWCPAPGGSEICTLHAPAGARLINEARSHQHQSTTRSEVKSEGNTHRLEVRALAEDRRAGRKKEKCRATPPHGQGVSLTSAQPAGSKFAKAVARIVGVSCLCCLCNTRGVRRTKLKVHSAPLTDRPSLTIFRISDPVCPDRPTRRAGETIGLFGSEHPVRPTLFLSLLSRFLIVPG